MENIDLLVMSLEEKCQVDVTYTESFKWYVVYIHFLKTTELFIVTKDCCEDDVRICKREKEILDYLKGKKLI